MAATALPAFIDALVPMLADRSGLADVRVFGCPLVDPRAAGVKAIVLAPTVECEQEAAAMSSPDISEAFTLKGLIICYKAMARDSTEVMTINAAAKAARDDAFAIYGEVMDALADDPTVDSTVLDAEVSGYTLEQSAAPEGQLGRIASIEFSIEAEAHTTP